MNYFFTWCLCMSAFSMSFAAVEVMKLEGNSVAPVLACDDAQTLHLIYFGGNAKAGDVYYRKRKTGDDAFSKPIKVNSQANSAMAIGGVRAPDMAVSSDGVVHVAWMSVIGGQQAIMYTHSNKDGSAFVPQRNLMQRSEGLDAGVAVTTFGEKKVYVIWTAHGKGNAEKDRLLFAAYSKDAGKTFSKESPINPDNPGICACCGIDAAVNGSGEVMVLYRSAGKSSRDMTLAHGKLGKKWSYQTIDTWNANMCPMSSMFIANGDEALLSWQTKESVFYTALDKNAKLGDKTAPSGMGKLRKHSVVARNDKGDICVVWTEGTGWNKGGSIHWQVLDNGGEEVDKGQKNDLPAWSKPSVVVTKDQQFLIAY